MEVVLANAYDVQNRRGHKTDPNDSRWLAHLLRHGMIRVKDTRPNLNTGPLIRSINGRHSTS